MGIGRSKIRISNIPCRELFTTARVSQGHLTSLRYLGSYAYHTDWGGLRPNKVACEDEINK